MKARLFKFALPVFALFIAVSFAFATEEAPTSTVGYYNHPILGVQAVPVQQACLQGTQVACQFNGFQLYKEASLSTPMRKNIN